MTEARSGMYDVPEGEPLLARVGKTKEWPYCWRWKVHTFTPETIALELWQKTEIGKNSGAVRMGNPLCGHDWCVMPYHQRPGFRSPHKTPSRLLTPAQDRAHRTLTARARELKKSKRQRALAKLRKESDRLREEHEQWLERYYVELRNSVATEPPSVGCALGELLPYIGDVHEIKPEPLDLEYEFLVRVGEIERTQEPEQGAAAGA